MSGAVGVPPLRVQVAFGGTPAALKTGASLTWTDVTAWLRTPAEPLSWSHGRSSESDAVAPGRCTFTLNIRDADGVPFHGGNPVRLRTPVRVLWNAVDGDDWASEFSDEFGPLGSVVLWVGTVDDWGAGWVNGVRPYTTVTCSDLVARCNVGSLQALPVATTLAAGSLLWCFPLDEDAGSMTAADRAGVPGAPRLTVASTGTGGAADFGGGYSPGSLASEAESTVLTLTPTDAGNYRYLSATGLTGMGMGSSFTIHAMLLPAAMGAGMTPIVLTGDNDAKLTIGVTAAGRATFELSCGFGGPLTVTGSTVITATDWTHLAVTITNNGSFDADNTTGQLYVNGVSQGTATATMIYSPLTRLWLGLLGAYTGNLANLTAHATVLSAATIARIAGGRTGWAGETTTARFARVAAAAGWTQVHVGTGLSTMSAMPTKGESLAAVLQKIADTEVAPWWIDREGTLRFEGRAYRYAADTAFTLPASVVDPSTQLMQSDAGLVNKLTASRPGGSQVTRLDQASIDAYDEYPTDLTLYVTSDADLEQVAAGLIGERATPRTRSDTIDVDLWASQASIGAFAPAVLAEVGDLCIGVGLPTDHGTSGDLPWFVEGVADVAVASSWRRTYTVSPADDHAAVILDHPIFALLDDNRLGF